MAEHADGPVRPSSGAYIQHLVLRVRDLESVSRLLHADPRFRAVRRAGAGQVPDYKMRFYRGSAERHHDLALAELLDPASAPPPETPWQMFGSTPGVDHIAVCYPEPGIVARSDRLDEVAGRRVPRPRQPRHDPQRVHRGSRRQRDRGVCTTCPTRCGRATSTRRLNHFENLPLDGPEAMVDDTNYMSFTSRQQLGASIESTRRVRRFPVGVQQVCACVRLVLADAR